MSELIVTRSLTKRFGSTVAVNEVDLSVREGDRYGFLGPNGSGKTTLVRMLLGLVYPTGGEIELLGHPVPRRVRSALPEVGALVETPAAVPHLSGRANLRLLDAAGPGGARRSRRARVEEALERVGLAGVDRRPVRTYSLGMRQRLGLAAALLRRPRLLILDAPTHGLEPRGIKEIRGLLLELNRGGVTVFLSSHLLSEVDELCNRVGIVDRGRLVRQADLSALRAPTGRVLVETPDPAAAGALLDGQVERRVGERLLIRSADPVALNARLVGGGVPVREMVVQRRTLEQVVFELTGDGTDRLAGRPPRTGGSASHAASAPADASALGDAAASGDWGATGERSLDEEAVMSETGGAGESGGEAAESGGGSEPGGSDEDEAAAGAARPRGWPGAGAATGGAPAGSAGGAVAGESTAESGGEPPSEPTAGDGST